MADQRTAMTRVIDANAASLVRSIIVTPFFKALLIQRGVFTPEVAELIFRRNWTESEQLDTMLRYLRRRIEESGCEVLDHFLKCLQETGHSHLSDSLYRQMREAAIDVGGMQEIGE